MAAGAVAKVVCSYPKGTEKSIFAELYRDGKIELELVPQGTLAERIRAAAAGIPAFFTPTGAGTQLTQGKETRMINGKLCVLEAALFADVALLEAWEADRWGNLTYRLAGRNFNPVMAGAAKLTIVQTQHVVALGQLDPDHIVTPGVYVNRVVHVPYGDPVH
jgi:3-oxoadipate CoA-transferase alpha subunit